MDFSSFYNGRPCKACTSTEEMMQIGKAMAEKEKQKMESANVKTESAHVKRGRSDCPVDKDELGRSTWNLLHTMSVYYPEEPSGEERETMSRTLDCLSKTYPCAPCAEDFRRDLKENPPTLDNRESFAKWMCEMHNRVNEKIGKDQFDCGQVMERWYDGWKDGSCDYK